MHTRFLHLKIVSVILICLCLTSCAKSCTFLWHFIEAPADNYVDEAIEKYNENKAVFSSLIESLSDVQSLLVVSAEGDKYINHRETMTVQREIGSLIIQTHFTYPAETYQELAAECQTFFDHIDAEAIIYHRDDGIYEIIYHGSAVAAVSYLYSAEGQPPDVEAYYIEKLTRINENWFVAIFESTI